MALATLTIDLRAETAKLTRDFGKANRIAERASSDMQRRARKVFNVAKVAAGALVVAGTAVAAAFLAAAGPLDRLAKQSDKLGILPEKLAGLRLAGEQTGVAVTTVDMALQRFTRRVAEAARGTGEAQGAIRELGLDAARLNRLPLEEQFSQIADAMAGVEQQSDKVRLSMKLFDSEGVALVNTLALGSGGLQQMQDDAERLGIAFNRADLKKVEDANDALNRVGKATSGLAGKFAIELAPQIEKIANFLEDIASTGGAVERVFQRIGRIGDKIAEINLATLGEDFGNLDALRQELALTEEAIGRAKLFDEVPGFFGFVDKIGQALLGPFGKQTDELEVLVRQREAILERIAKFETFVGPPVPPDFQTPTIAQTFDSATISGTSEADAAKAAELALAKQRLQVEQLKSAYDGYALSVERRIALTDSDTEASRVNFEIQQGQFRKLSEDRQQELREMAQRIDDITAQNKKQAEFAEVEQSLLGPAERINQVWDARIQIIKDAGLAQLSTTELIAKAEAQRAAELARSAGTAGGRLTDFMSEAARASQRAFVDFFRSTDDGLKGMVKGFGNAMLEVAQQIAAAGLAELIFGAAAGGNGSGIGAVGSIASFFAGFFDSGGTIPRGSYGIVAERRPEIIDLNGRGFLVPGPANVTSGSDTAAMRGGGNANVTVNIQNNSSAVVGQPIVRTNPDGGLGVELIIDAVRQGARDGMLDDEFNQRFGIRAANGARG